MEQVENLFRREKIPLSKDAIAKLYAASSAAGNGQIDGRCLELWKNSDLRKWTDVRTSSSLLKYSRSGAKASSVSEPLILQIDSLRDISKPAYQQLQKAVNRFGENVLVSGDADPQEKKGAEECGKRMLLVEFTDGVAAIRGMEYNPITQLSVLTPPGTKVRLLPPIICRKGMLLLKASNVQVIGGSVPELCDRFSQKHVLAAKLKGKDKDTLLAEMEKAAPPCPPPNRSLLTPGTQQSQQSAFSQGIGNTAPGRAQNNDFHFDPDGDAFLAQVPLDEFNDPEEDDFLTQALDEFEAQSVSCIVID